jgi:hypothetical protein
MECKDLCNNFGNRVDEADGHVVGDVLRSFFGRRMMLALLIKLRSWHRRLYIEFMAATMSFLTVGQHLRKKCSVKPSGLGALSRGV